MQYVIPNEYKVCYYIWYLLAVHIYNEVVFLSLSLFVSPILSFSLTDMWAEEADEKLEEILHR